jgi:hypothetical protein
LDSDFTHRVKPGTSYPAASVCWDHRFDRRDGPGMETDSDFKIRVAQREDGELKVEVDLRDIQKSATCHVPVRGGGGKKDSTKGNVLVGNGYPAAQWLQPPHEFMQRPLGASRFGWWLAGLLGMRRSWLEGPIYIDEVFVREQDKAHARESIRVTRVYWNGKNNIIESSRIDSTNCHANDEARFREACVRVK